VVASVCGEQYHEVRLNIVSKLPQLHQVPLQRAPPRAADRS
jgi:hypothetical protein